MSKVKLPPPLRAHAGNSSTVELPGGTVRECLESLEERYPAVKTTLRDGDGELAPAINLYVNGEDVRYRDGLDTAVSETDTITIVLALAGG